MNIVEPKGSTQILQGEELYTETQYDIYQQGESTGFQIQKLYSLATPRVREQFNKICKDMKQFTAFLDVENYLLKVNLSMEELLRNGFDDLTLYDCIFHTSMREMLQELQLQSGKQTLQRQLKYILEVRLMSGLPFVVEDNEQVAAQFTEENLKGSFDSYAIVPQGFYNVTQPQQPVTRHDNSMPFYEKFKIFKRDSYIATKLIIVYFDTHNNDLDADLCQVCLECKTKGISREAYFTGNQTSQQVKFTPNKAVLFCQNDNLRLCRECDQLLHRGVLQRHNRVPFGGQCRLSQCPKHIDEKLQYEDASTGIFMCPKCVQERSGGNLSGVRSVEDVFNQFLSERPGKVNINAELQTIYDQQTKLEAVLNNIRAFNATVEDALLEYFRGIVQQLAAHQNQLVQQILGQLCVLNRSSADLVSQHSFITKNQTNLSANEILAFSRKFDKQRAKMKEELEGQTYNVFHFVNGLTEQIDRFKNAYTTIPVEHLVNMQKMYQRYQFSRLYGLYSKNTSETPIYIGGEIKNDYGIEQQKLNDKLKDVNSYYDDVHTFKASGDKYSDELAMNVFNVVKNHPDVFRFHLQDQPIYEQLRLSMKQKQEQMQQTQQLQQQTTHLNIPTEVLTRDQSVAYHEPELTQQQQNQLSQSIFKNTSILKHNGVKDKDQYVNDLFEDGDYDTSRVIHNAVQVNKDYTAIPQSSQLHQVFDIASRNAQIPDQAKGAEKYQIQPQINVTGNSHIPQVDGQRNLQESVSPRIKQSEPEPLVNPNIHLSAAPALVNPEMTQVLPEKSVSVIGDHKTLSASFENLQKIYKIAERNQELPNKYFSEVIQSPQLRQMLYFQMAHTLKKERQYQKLKLIPVSRKFDRRRGMKFAAIMEICKGVPCMMIVSLHFGNEPKQLALSICSGLEQGSVQSKYQFLCDLDTQELVESQEFIFAQRQWTYGAICTIAKDFAGVEYNGKYWTCDSVDVYCFDE